MKIILIALLVIAISIVETVATGIEASTRDFNRGPSLTNMQRYDNVDMWLIPTVARDFVHDPSLTNIVRSNFVANGVKPSIIRDFVKDPSLTNTSRISSVYSIVDLSGIKNAHFKYEIAKKDIAKMLMKLKENNL